MIGGFESGYITEYDGSNWGSFSRWCGVAKRVYADSDASRSGGISLRSVVNRRQGVPGKCCGHYLLGALSSRFFRVNTHPFPPKAL